MKLIKSLFVAIIAAVMTTIAGSVLTTLFDEARDAQNEFNLLNILGTKVYAEENNIDTLEDANQTFTTSLNTYTPSTVIDNDNILPTPQSQSPSEKENEEENENSDYVNILANLVPISGEDINYQKIFGISDAEIKTLIEESHMDIWQIAHSLDQVELLERTYYAIYPARIIQMLELGIITEDSADLLIEQANEDIAAHINVSIEQMIENLPTTD